MHPLRPCLADWRPAQERREWLAAAAYDTYDMLVTCDEFVNKAGFMVGVLGSWGFGVLSPKTEFQP
jgi:hypothetical protein